MRMIMLAAVASCASPAERSSSPDAGTKPGPDASNGGPTETNVTCTDYTRTITHSSGERDVYVYKKSVVDIAPGADFTVLICYPANADPLAPSCPSGAMCTGSDGPVGKRCFAQRDAVFIDSRLVIDCGFSYAHYNTSGAMTNSITSFPESIKLIRR